MGISIDVSNQLRESEEDKKHIELLHDRILREYHHNGMTDFIFNGVFENSKLLDDVRPVFDKATIIILNSTDVSIIDIIRAIFNRYINPKRKSEINVLKGLFSNDLKSIFRYEMEKRYYVDINDNKSFTIDIPEFINFIRE